ncbi:glycosyl transferase family 9 [Rahnella victoriana]|nr:glycosyl transferase family 9 [Rahnella victoriana]
MKAMKMKLIKTILHLYCLLTRRKTFSLSARTAAPENIVIYSTTALGDYLMNTPAIMHLKKSFPASRFILVTSKKNHSLVVQYNWYDDIYVWDNKVVRILPLILKLRKHKPDLSVILHAHFPYDVLCAVLSGSKMILRDHYGSEPAVFNHYLDHYSGYFDGHTIRRKLKLIEPVCENPGESRMHLPVINTPAPRLYLRKRIGFQLGASNESRRWPVEFFSQLAGLLLNEYRDLDIIITGTAAEKYLAEDFLKRLPAHHQNNICIMSGQTPLTGLVTLVKSLNILVTGDTGPLHIAVAAGVRTVSLFATANPAYTGPCQDPQKHIILHRPEGKNAAHPMRAILPADVYQAVGELLRRPYDC